jgi:hypothetical protein
MASIALSDTVAAKPIRPGRKRAAVFKNSAVLVLIVGNDKVLEVPASADFSSFPQTMPMALSIPTCKAEARSDPAFREEPSLTFSELGVTVLELIDPDKVTAGQHDLLCDIQGNTPVWPVKWGLSHRRKIAELRFHSQDSDCTKMQLICHKMQSKLARRTYIHRVLPIRSSGKT